MKRKNQSEAQRKQEREDVAGKTGLPQPESPSYHKKLDGPNRPSV